MITDIANGISIDEERNIVQIQFSTPDETLEFARNALVARVRDKPLTIS